MSQHVCKTCGAELVVTYDALNRPRRRCPQCQGISPVHPGPTEHHPLHNQLATCPAELEYQLADEPQPKIKPRWQKPKAVKSRPCIYCSAPVEQAPVGRPRKRCRDELMCAERAGRAARRAS
jgi:hypothetical protein